MLQAKDRPEAWTPIAVAEAFTRSAIEDATDAAMREDVGFSWWCAEVVA